ncbi:MAG: hypothetical protein A3K18_05695 [Lentisphaerae bacterium RIFOXYA12_64_32]|nr:MAG: hypothetical protein A3K18_05695 [Lentisphaerae bacterium RIFOXYA12_64_32]
MKYLLLVVLSLSGCVRAYSVTALQGSDAYVIVKTGGGGTPRIYDCRSNIGKEYDPTCTRVDFREKVKPSN